MYKAVIFDFDYTRLYPEIQLNSIALLGKLDLFFFMA